MATVKETMNRAARMCSVTPPPSWLSVTALRHTEMLDFLDSTVEDLQDRIDWPAPVGEEQEITGTGVTTYNLNTNFKRLMDPDLAVFETTNIRREVIPVKTDGEWAWLNEIGSAGAFRFYRTAGDEESGHTIDFFRALGVGDTIKVQYVSKNWLVSNGTEGSTWLLDADTLLLPRKLIELGVVWRFRQRKGLGYNDVLAEYETKLTREFNRRRSNKKIGYSSSIEPVHPMRVPVPDFIPSS